MDVTTQPTEHGDGDTGITESRRAGPKTYRAICPTRISVCSEGGACRIGVRGQSREMEVSGEDAMGQKTPI